MSNELKDKYIKYYQNLHDAGAFSGGSLKYAYVEPLRALINTTQSKTLLDYGCGKAFHYFRKDGQKTFPEALGFPLKNIAFYDPGYEKFKNLPKGTFDGVICTDVLEHIHPDLIDDVLDEIFSKANKFVFLVIYCGLAAKTLPNGENAHLIVERPEWWNKKLSKYYDSNVYVHVKYMHPADPASNVLKL